MSIELKKIAEEIREIISNRQNELGLTFEEERHLYTMNGKSDWPSVSKVLKKFYKEFPTDEAAMTLRSFFPSFSKGGFDSDIVNK